MVMIGGALWMRFGGRTFGGGAEIRLVWGGGAKDDSFNMKITKLCLGIVLISVLVFGTAGTHDAKDAPPGVPIEHWVAINDSLGFVIGNPRPVNFETRKTNVLSRVPGVTNEVEVNIPTGFAADAVLMTKLQGHWCRLDLVPPPPRAELSH